MKDSSVKGRIINVGPVQELGSNGFTKRTFVVETEGDHPQKMPFELTKEKTELVTENDNGREIEVHFNLRASEWNGRYFVNLQAWKVSFFDAAPQKAELPKITDSQFQQTLIKVKAGSVTPEKVKESFSMSDAQYRLLKEAAIPDVSDDELPF
jgi:hypothetical protein